MHQSDIRSNTDFGFYPRKFDPSDGTYWILFFGFRIAIYCDWFGSRSCCKNSAQTKSLYTSHSNYQRCVFDTNRDNDLDKPNIINCHLGTTEWLVLRLAFRDRCCSIYFCFFCCWSIIVSVSLCFALSSSISGLCGRTSFWRVFFGWRTVCQ